LKRGAASDALHKGERVRIIAVFIGFLILSGCATAVQTSYRMTQKEQAMYDYFISQGFDKNKATVYALNPGVQQTYFDDMKCQGYGAKPGSDAYVACRAQLEASQKTVIINR
jgi:hypothetical protein